MQKILSKLFYILLIPFFLYNFYLLSFLPLKGEVHLTNDIGRDFFLLQELDQKKIVLIGPRSNTTGVFHGPLWTYMNYPAYLIGNGDPVVVAWFWVILGVIFLVSTFFIVRNLFGELPAALCTMLLAVDLVPHINSVFSPDAIFFFIPFFLFTIYKYLQGKKVYFLALHFITLGVFVHLNIGVGILFVMLSTILACLIIIKNKLWKHFLSFLFLPLFISNFIVFDLKHNFNMAKALLNLGENSNFFIPFNSWIQNRVDNILSMQILSNNTPLLAFVLFSFLMIFTIIEIKKNNKERKFYFLLLFYYFGYMALSYFNKGIILSHYVYLLIPLSAIWLGALAKSSYKYIFIPLICIIIFLNFNYAKSYVNYTQQFFMNKHPDSWVTLRSVADQVVKEEKGKEFGYYVYSPDSFAYQQRYAMTYVFKVSNMKALEYVKKPVTYIIVTPPPPDNPYMLENWWIENQAQIKTSPAEIKTMSGGYKIEKFLLTPEEQSIPHNKNIELKLTFR